MEKHGFALALALTFGALGCSGDDDDGEAPPANGGIGGSSGGNGAAGAGSAGSGASGSSGADAGADGSAGTAGESSAPWPDDLSAFEACRLYFTAICDRYVACGLFERERCMRRVATCPDRLFAEGSAWTIEKARACAPEWAAFDCDQAARLLGPACDDHRGTRAVGDSCIFDDQCASGACSARYVFQEQCGVCQNVAAPGGACGADLACPRGQDCGEGSVCVDQLLMPGSETPGPPAALGQPCTAFPGCAEGLSCEAPGEGTTEGTCVAAPPLGAACVETFGSAGLCAEGATCDSRPGGTCVALGQIGEPCGFTACVPEAYCNVIGDDFGQSHTCLAPRVPGDPCVRAPGFERETSVCADGLECIEVNDAGDQPPLCATPRELGESCDGRLALCVDGGRCEGGTCVAPPADRGFFAAACVP